MIQMRITISEMNLLIMKMRIKLTMPLMKGNTMMTELKKEGEKQPLAQQQDQTHPTQLQVQSQKLQV